MGKLVFNSSDPSDIGYNVPDKMNGEQQQQQQKQSKKGPE